MGQNVIVTGGLGALGRAVASNLTQQGFKVAVVDLAPAPASSDAACVLGGVDLTDPQAVEAAYAEADKQLGGVSGLVNIAGGFVWEPVEGGELDNFDRMYRMNVRTAAVSSRSALPFLLKNGGSIVNVGAFAVKNPSMGMASYTASKAGVHALTESLADEVKGKGVRVNAVLPTIIDTPTNRKDMPDADTSEWVKPESAAAVIAFLLSDQSRAVTGATVPLNLGN